jgi:hypothetical protein
VICNSFVANAHISFNVARFQLAMTPFCNLRTLLLEIFIHSHSHQPKKVNVHAFVCVGILYGLVTELEANQGMILPHMALAVQAGMHWDHNCAKEIAQLFLYVVLLQWLTVPEQRGAAMGLQIIE